MSSIPFHLLSGRDRATLAEAEAVVKLLGGRPSDKVFTPRPYQTPVLDALTSGAVKRAACVWHRRSGKDLTFFNFMVRRALEKRAIYYYFFPTYRQGKKALWDGMDGAGRTFLSFAPRWNLRAKNDTEMKLRFKNGSIIQIVGVDNYDSIMGTNPRGCVFSEFALQDPRAWDYIRPILRENGGWALFNFTPRGRNHAYDLYKMAACNAEWFAQTLTVADTGALSEADIEAERQAGMSERLIRQEFYCSFDVGAAGAFWDQAWIDQYRTETAPEFSKIVLVVDPATTSGAALAEKRQRLPDETGVAVAGIGKADDVVYILHSDGYRLPPAEWAARVVALYDLFNCDYVFAETNQGGEMVVETLRRVRPNLAIRAEHTSRAKQSRAEPISLLYKAGRVRHVGHFPILEDQLTSFPTACDYDDRLDAAVYVATELTTRKQIQLGVVRPAGMRGK